MSVVERARIVRVPSEAQLERALLGLLEAPSVPGRLGRGGPGTGPPDGPPAHRPAPLAWDAPRRPRGPPDPARTRAAPGARTRARLPRRPSRRRARRPRARATPGAAARSEARGASATTRARPPPRCRPVNLGRGARRAGRDHRPQLAAQAGGDRPRDAAVRGLRGVAGQQHLPRADRDHAVNQPPDTVVTNQLARRRARSSTSPRTDVPVPGPGRLPSPPWTSPTCEPDGNPVTVPGQGDAGRPADLDHRRSGPRRSRSTLDRRSRSRSRSSSTPSEPPDGLAARRRSRSRRRPSRSPARRRSSTAVVSARVTRHHRRQRRQRRPRRASPTPSTPTARSSPASTSSRRLVHLEIPVFENLENRTVPVNPVVTGTPGAGLPDRVGDRRPAGRHGRGRPRRARRAGERRHGRRSSVSGATRNVTVEVPFTLPTGVTAIGVRDRARHRAHRARDRDPHVHGRHPASTGAARDFQYVAADTQVLLTVFGSTADLDRLAASPIVISVDVGGLEPGTHEVPVVPTLDSVYTVAAVSPETVTVTVIPRPTPTPGADAHAGARADRSRDHHALIRPVRPAPTRTRTLHDPPLRHRRHPRCRQRGPAPVAGVRARPRDGPPDRRHAARSSWARTRAARATCSWRRSRPGRRAWASTSTRSGSSRRRPSRSSPGPASSRPGSWSRRRTTRPRTTASRCSTRAGSSWTTTSRTSWRR